MADERRPLDTNMAGGDDAATAAARGGSLCTGLVGGVPEGGAGRVRLGARRSPPAGYPPRPTATPLRAPRFGAALRGGALGTALAALLARLLDDGAAGGDGGRVRLEGRRAPLDGVPP